MKLIWPLASISFNWRTLLRIAAIGDLVVLLAMVLTLLALALAGIVLLGLGLLRFRGGILGVAILGLVFADIAAYTLTGAVNNILYREELLDLLIPASLAALSLAGLMAAVAVVVRRRRPESDGGAAQIAGLAAAAIFVLLLFAGLVAGREPELPVRQSTLLLETENIAYSTTELSIESSEVTVSLANHDLFWHTFTIDELNVNLQVPVRGERQVTFSVLPGTYPFYCAIPGHALVGMRGTLTVR